MTFLLLLPHHSSHVFSLTHSNACVQTYAQELLAALRASELAAGAGGAQEHGDWGAQGSWAGERDLPLSEQERDIIFQIRSTGFWELTEVEPLLILLSCLFCAYVEVCSASRARAPAQRETNEKGRDTASKGGGRDGECGCVRRYMCDDVHALGACMRACVRAGCGAQVAATESGQS